MQAQPRTAAASKRRAALRQECSLETFPDQITYVLADGTIGQRFDKHGNLKRINGSTAIPHGTVGGYQNYRCTCIWTPATTPMRWWHEGLVIPTAEVARIPVRGCERVAVAAVLAGRERRRAEADAQPLRIAPPQRHDGGGRHRRKEPDPAQSPREGHPPPQPDTARPGRHHPPEGAQ